MLRKEADSTLAEPAVASADVSVPEVLHVKAV